jgi:ankyrin repeat protein
MKRTYTLFQQSIAYALLVSFFLQSCGGKFGNNPLTSTQEEEITSIQTNSQQVRAVQGRHVNTFYETDGKEQAEDGQEIGQMVEEQKKPVKNNKGKRKLMEGEEQEESDGEQGFENDLDRYQKLYRLATIGKEAETQFLLGLRAHSLWKREGQQEQAYQEAINWFEKAANQDHQAAIALLQELRTPSCKENIALNATKQFILPIKQVNHLVKRLPEDEQQQDESQSSQELNELFQKGKKAYRAWRKFKSDIDCQAAIQCLQEADKEGCEPASKLLKRLQIRLHRYQQYQKNESERQSDSSDLYAASPQHGSSYGIPIARRLEKENLAGLPVEIWRHILSYLRDNKQIAITRQVSHTFDGLIGDILSDRLQKAIIMGDESQVMEVIKSGFKIQIEDEDGANPLYLATDKGHLEIVKLLLRAPYKGTAGFIGKACEVTIKEMAKLLIVSVARIKLKNKYINAKNKEGNTPLHLAAEKGQLGLVNLFLKHERAGMYTQNHNGQLPLHLAAQEGHVEIVKLLGSVYAVDNNGQTPLHLAAQQGHLEVARVLIAKDAQINVQDINRKTPLQLAILNKHSALEKFLLAKAKKPNNRTKYGFYRG